MTLQDCDRCLAPASVDDRSPNQLATKVGVIFVCDPCAGVKSDYAWVHLVRLCGVNLRVPVERRGKSVFVTAQSQRFRIRADEFDAGKAQYRGDWAIERWSEKAERRATAERNWMD